MTLPIPPILSPDGHLDPSAVQFAFDTIARAFPFGKADLRNEVRHQFPQLNGSTGDHYLIFGTASVVFTASATAANTTVTHGLGTTPTQVVLGLGAIVVDTLAFTDTYTSTTFRLRATQAQAVAKTGTQTVHWLAIA